MLEVEMKFPVDDLAQLEDRLGKQGAQFKDRQEERDSYHSAPYRDFAKTDEALRVRRIGDSSRITYKGPKRDAETKTREEIEVPLDTGHSVAGDMARLLTALGFRHVADITKWRNQYRLEWQGFEVVIALDRVQDVGDYIELEVMAPEDQYEAARTAVTELGKQLGLARPERRSYLELWLEKHGGKS